MGRSLLNILVACEYSGAVRDAFIEKGHNAISCDILPTEKPDPAFEYINKKGVIKREYFTYSKNGHQRSKTFNSIAKAMAEQWG